MTETSMKLSPDQHRQCAKALFNSVWTLLEQTGRTKDEDDLMIHRAHAMMLHWLQVGEPVNFARGEWQLARVYAVLGRFEPALHHAQRCREICEDNALGAFDKGFACEALARAHAVGGNEPQMASFLDRAGTIARQIDDQEDRAILLADLTTVRPSPDKT
jgi:hypothetical protein